MALEAILELLIGIMEKMKKAAILLEYSSYSEFVRRTALIEASKIIKENTPFLYIYR